MYLLETSMPRAKVKIHDRTIHLGDTFPLFRLFIMDECDKEDDDDDDIIRLHIKIHNR